MSKYISKYAPHQTVEIPDLEQYPVCCYFSQRDRYQTCSQKGQKNPWYQLTFSCREQDETNKITCAASKASACTSGVFAVGPVGS